MAEPESVETVAADPGDLTPEELAAQGAREDRVEKMEEEPAQEYTDEERAQSDAIKVEANAAFSAKNFQQAIDLYTAAIAVVPSAPLHSNRAFCHIKLEALGSAIVDADAAIKLDKLYAKAYYRKGTILAMQSKHKPARKEFLKVCKLAPKDKNAVSKYTKALQLDLPGRA